jgi:integrase
VIKKLPAEVKRTRTFKPGEAKELALAIPVWLRPIVVVALESGLRRTNTVLLKKEWIHWDINQIIIPPEFHKAGRRTGKPYIVDINATVRAELRNASLRSKSEYVFTQEERKTLLKKERIHWDINQIIIPPEFHKAGCTTGKPYIVDINATVRAGLRKTGRRSKSEYVLTEEDRKTPFSLYAVSVAFMKAAIKAGLKNLRFHDLRREFGTMVAKLTGSFVAAQEALNVTPQTARIYIQTTSEDASEAFKAIETNGAGAVLSQIYHNGQKKRATDSVTH